jgi:predicted small lipoprotein YifL
MKTFLRSILGLLALAAALAACSKAPLHVPLDDFTVKIDATTNTLGRVVYPKDPAAFKEPVVNVKTITVSGKVTASYSSLTGDELTLTFYARATSPENNPNCSDGGVVWICDKDGEKPITGAYTFSNGQTQSITFGTSNADVLAEAVNHGEVWIGAEVSSGVATGVELNFTNMVASVTLF